MSNNRAENLFISRDGTINPDALDAFVTSFDKEFNLRKVLEKRGDAFDTARQWDKAMTTNGPRTKMLYNIILAQNQPATVDVEQPITIASTLMDTPIPNTLVELTTGPIVDIGTTVDWLMKSSTLQAEADALLQDLNFDGLTALAEHILLEVVALDESGSRKSLVQSWVQSAINKQQSEAGSEIVETTTPTTTTYPVGSSDERLTAFKDALGDYDMIHGSVPFDVGSADAQPVDEEAAWMELQIKFVFTGWLSNDAFVKLKSLVRETEIPDFAHMHGLTRMHGLTELKRQITNFTTFHETRAGSELPNYTNPVKELVKEQLLEKGAPNVVRGRNSIIKELIQLYETIIKINGKFETHMKEQVLKGDNVHSAYLLLIKSIQERAWKTADYDAAKNKISNDAATITAKDKLIADRDAALKKADEGCNIKIKTAQELLKTSHAKEVATLNDKLLKEKANTTNWKELYDVLAKQINAVQTKTVNDMP